ncbi:MAG TPA: PKD domain-containing protein [Vicinamibacterales bacterium]|nr:PKD domain-containing protein [Vicinamibacterales bacterium]
MWTRSGRIIGMLALAVVAASCTVKDTDAPALAGPSELALSLSLQALPDSIYQDGSSQSSVTIDARGPNSQPVRGVSLRVDMEVGGVMADFGTLSARTVVTGDDGLARVIYTAPPAPLDPTAGTVVTLLVTPIGGDYRGEVNRQVDIRLIPRGVILPPNGAPQAAFTFSPSTPQMFQTISFDASGTQDEGVPCGTRCSYQWTFGDGDTASGQVVPHEYRAAGSYVVSLRVVDERGQSAQITKPLQVAAGTPPTAAFTFSPDNPAVSQDIFFNAGESHSAASSGRRIIYYDWDFGSGRTANGMTVAKRYDTAGKYTVTLTVTDDAFQQDTESKQITVGASGTGPVASLVVSPTGPRVGQAVVLDGTGSSGPSAIVEYRFSYGDGTPDPPPQTTPTRPHTYGATGTYVARLTVLDSAGRTATTTVNVTVVP